MTDNQPIRDIHTIQKELDETVNTTPLKEMLQAFGLALLTGVPTFLSFQLYITVPRWTWFSLLLTLFFLGAGVYFLVTMGTRGAARQEKIAKLRAELDEARRAKRY